MNSDEFWDSCEKVNKMLDIVCRLIGILESETATMSDAYAAMLLVRL